MLGLVGVEVRLGGGGSWVRWVGVGGGGRGLRVGRPYLDENTSRVGKGCRWCDGEMGHRYLNVK